MRKLLSLFGKWIVARFRDPKTYVALFVVSGFCDATIQDGFVTKAHAQTDIIWLQPSGSTTFNQTVFSTATKWKSETLAASPTAGAVLTTDGTNSSWGSQFALPSQTGKTNQVLTTNGTSPAWSPDVYFNVSTTTSGVATFYLTTDKTSSGAALYPSATTANLAVIPLVNDATFNYTYGWSYNSGTKALTVTARSSSQTNVALIGLTVLGVPANVANGTSVTVMVKGN